MQWDVPAADVDYLVRNVPIGPDGTNCRSRGGKSAMAVWASGGDRSQRAIGDSAAGEDPDPDTRAFCCHDRLSGMMERARGRRQRIYRLYQLKTVIVCRIGYVSGVMTLLTAFSDKS